MTSESIQVGPGLYRNPKGAEIRVLCELNRNFRRHDPLFKRGIVPATLGTIWLAEDDTAYGLGRLLVTAEGLTSCGYVRITDDTAAINAEENRNA